MLMQIHQFHNPSFRRVQDLRHILDYLFYLPYQFENHEMTMHQIIVNIINKHAAKEPLTEDDVTYIE